MQRPDLGLFDGSTRLRTPTERATALSVATGPRGLESVTADIPLATFPAFDLYGRLGQLEAEVTAAGVRVARGRCEDLSITGQGARVTALGPWRELSDVPYTALWSNSGTEGWAPVSAAQRIARAPEMYEIELSDRIAIQPTKGASYANLIDVGSVGLRTPDAGARTIVGVQFSLALLLPSNWTFQVATTAGANFGGAISVAATLTASGVLQSRAYHLVLTAGESIEIAIFNQTGGASAPAGETGDWYAIITNLRVVTSTANRVNTTLTANRAAGTSVTATVGSTAGMYAGMQLVMNSGAATSEIVTVESVTSATQFVATFAFGYTSGQAVQGHKVRSDEVASSLLAFTKGVNAGGALGSSAALIEACDRDLLSALWEDTTPADIIADLAERGDGSQRYETGAGGDGLLYFRPAGSAARAWFVDASDLEITQTLDGLVNSVTPRYQAADGRTLRGATAADAVSVDRYGVTRRGVVDADTTSATIAGQVAATALAETADPVPRAGLTVTRIYTEAGQLAPLWLPRAGDTVTIRNLLPSVGSAINRLQTFRLAGTAWDALAGTLGLTPESPQPTYESQAAAIQQAAEVAASLGGTPAATPITVLPPQQTRRRNPPRPPTVLR